MILTQKANDSDSTKMTRVHHCSCVFGDHSKQKLACAALWITFSVTHDRPLTSIADTMSHEVDRG